MCKTNINAIKKNKSIGFRLTSAGSNTAQVTYAAEASWHYVGGHGRATALLSYSPMQYARKIDPACPRPGGRYLQIVRDRRLFG